MNGVVSIWVWSAATAVARASWQAAVLAALVFLLQGLLKDRISARVRYGLWFLVVLRLALPVVPESRFSLYNLCEGRGQRPNDTALIGGIVALKSDAAIPNQAPDSARDGRTDQPTPKAAGLPVPQRPDGRPAWQIPWTRGLAVIWVAGMLLLAVRLFWASVRLGRQVRRLERVADPAVLELLGRSALELGLRGRQPPILAGEAVAGPALLGWLHPRILLPVRLVRELDRRDLRLVLLHELAHLKRHDVAANWMLAILLVVHWYNPVAWLVFRRLRIERELACDELVLSAGREAERQAYGQVIIRLLETVTEDRRGGAVAGAVGILEGKQQLGRRITMIARSTRRGWGWTAVAAVAALMLGCSALTDGVKAQAAQAAAPAPVPATNPAAKPGVPGMQATTAPAAGTQEQLNQATYRVLARRVPAVALDTVPLVDVLDFLRDATGLNMAVNWRALEAAGVDQRAPVSLRLRDVSVEQALKLVLRQVGGGQVRLDYTVDRGVVIISTADELSQDVSAQAYDVADLLEQENPGNPSEAAGKLIQVIENSVAPDSWRSAHGTIGSMIRYGNKLVVTQTPANQRAVAQLLEALRGQGAVSHGTKGTGQLTPPSPTSVPATRGEQWQRNAEQIRTE